MTTKHLESLDMNGFVATIKRTSRKGSVGFRLSLGQVVVLAPKHISMVELRLILASKSKLILAKLKAQELLTDEQAHPLAVKRHYVSGERLAYLDGELLLQVGEGGFSVKRMGADEIKVSVPFAKTGAKTGPNPEWVRNALVRWYKLQAQKHMQERVGYFAPMVGAWPKAIEIKTYRARWGSCTSAGLVQFNWKLMMAPGAVVDSVVVHELCHLLHMHHGAEFWAQVKRVLPAYQDAKQWLKDEGRYLGLD